MHRTGSLANISRLSVSCDYEISKHIFKKTRGLNGTCETKAIHSDLGILMYSSLIKHIPTYSDIIRLIQELFRHIKTYSELCATMVY